MEEIKNLDVSIVVLPKMRKPKELVPSHLEHVQPFAHVYLLVRYFC